MASPRYLTKSRFKLAVECPAKLFYSGNKAYKNTKNEDSFLAFLANGGFQVGELAKLMYPGGHEIKTKTHAEAESETRKLLEQDNVVLFEPAIRCGNLFIRIDILVKRGNSFELIEVKAKSYHPETPKIMGARGDILAAMLPYIQDVAFQKHVLQGVFPEAAITTFLLMADKSKHATIDGLNELFRVERSGERIQVIVDPRATEQGCGEPILAKVSVDPYVGIVLDTGVEFPGGHLPLPEAATLWASAYQDNVRIDPVLGSHCGKCEFRAPLGDALKSGFHECWRGAAGFADSDFVKGTVLDIYNFRGKDKLIKQGVYKLTQVNEDDLKVKHDGDGLSLSERQLLQVSGIPAGEDKGGFYFDEGYIYAEMATWTYPYHFIDFETSGVALPFYKGMRPYESVAFQFSHHTMSADGQVQHVDECLLAEPGQFPNYVFARALKRSLTSDNGSVFMWHHHENTILRAIATQLREDANPPTDKDELIVFLESLIKGGSRAMVDLCALAKRAYFHPDTKGSSSIKKVLPAVLKTSEFLRAKYSQPIYGAADGIPSKNYKDFVWWRSDNGVVVEPYDLLKDAAQSMLGEDADDQDDDDLEVAEGGAAAAAFSRLQYECLDAKARGEITNALLRYCELDTLAMVMIVEAWRAEVA
jgi:hypothetical protein